MKRGGGRNDTVKKIEQWLLFPSKEESKKGELCCTDHCES